MHHIEMCNDGNGNGVHRNVVEHVVHNVFLFLNLLKYKTQETKES